MSDRIKQCRHAFFWQVPLFALGSLGLSVARAEPTAEGSREVAEAGEYAGIFPPLVGDIMLCLAILLIVFLLLAMSYLWSMVREQERIIFTLQQGLKFERRPPKPPTKQKKAAAKQAKQATTVAEGPWQSFVQEYNAFARNLSGAGTEKECGQFMRQHDIIALTCIKGEDNPNEIEYSPVQNAVDGKYWAWQIPGEKNLYAVVPNPQAAYDKELHEQGGMKETFASNYSEGSSYAYFEITLPATVRDMRGKWTIEQPGMMRLS